MDNLCPKCQVNERIIFKTGNRGVYCKQCSSEKYKQKIQDPEYLEIRREKARENYHKNKEKYRNKEKRYLDNLSVDQKLNRKSRYRKYQVEKTDEHRDKNRFQKYSNRGAKIVDRRLTKSIIYMISEGICGICKKPVSYEEATIDHIIPLSLGGNHVEENVCVAHFECNTWKSGVIDRVQLDFIHGIP